MTEVYEFPREVNGETRKEFVILSSNFKRDFLQVVHNVAVDYCLASGMIAGKRGHPYGPDAAARYPVRAGDHSGGPQVGAASCPRGGGLR